MLTGPLPATEKVLKLSGMSIKDIDLFEVNEAFASVPLSFMEHFGVEHEKVNVNGGAIAMGHPLGATGIANIYEVCTHLRGEAGKRQVENAKIGLTHVIGLGSACGIHILEKV